jgi:hypothetical protein
MSKVWRERVTYVAMSLFVVWHTLAMAVAPAPSSEVTDGLRTLLTPYLDFFRLDNEWNFFAPDVGNDAVLRYVITDAAGVEHPFDPNLGLNWFHPSYIWFRAWYVALIQNPADFGEEFAALFCRQHAALHPVTLTFLELELQDYAPQDLLNGELPLDTEFVKVTKLGSYKCPS